MECLTTFPYDRNIKRDPFSNKPKHSIIFPALQYSHESNYSNAVEIRITTVPVGRVIATIKAEVAAADWGAF